MRLGWLKFFVVTWLALEENSGRDQSPMKRQNSGRLSASLLPLLSLALTIVGTTFSVAAQARQPVPEIAFTVSMAKPHTHMLDVEVRIKHGPGEPVAKEEVRPVPAARPISSRA